MQLFVDIRFNVIIFLKYQKQIMPPGLTLFEKSLGNVIISGMRQNNSIKIDKIVTGYRSWNLARNFMEHDTDIPNKFNYESTFILFRQPNGHFAQHIYGTVNNGRSVKLIVPEKNYKDALYQSS